MKNISYILQLAAYFTSLALIGGIPGLAMPLEDSALGSVNRLIGGLVMLLWLLSVVATGRLGRLHLFHLLAIAFALWYVLSVWWSVAPDETPFTTTLIEGVVLSVMIWDIYRTQERLEAAMQAFLLGGYVSVGMTAFNFAQGQQVRHWEQRFSGSGFDPNDIALLLAIGIPMATYLATRPHSPPLLRLLNLLYPLATALGIVLSGSRGALLAAAPAYLFFLVRMARLSRGWGIAMAVFLSAALLGATQLDLSAPLQRLGTVAESSGDDHLSGRSDIWQAGWNAFGAHPFLGVGGGAFSAATKGRNGQVLALIAHNTYLSVLTELGPIGFLLFLGLLVVVLKSALRQAPPMREMSLLALLVWGVGVFALSWEFRSQTWLLFGLVVAAGHSAPPALSRPFSPARAGLLAGRAGP